MRVCFFINTLDGSGGTERMTVILANHLAEIGYDIHIISKQGGNKTFFILNQNINQHYLYEESNINIYATYFDGLRKYKSAIQIIEPDYIVDVCVAMSLMTIPAVAGKKQIKVVSWEHFNANAYFNFVTAKLSKWLASKFAYCMVVLTDTDKNIYNEKFKPRRIAVIKNPVTLNVNTKSSLKPKYVLAIGRLTDQKGFDMLLNAWALITTKASGWKLRIIGSGELEADLKKQCDDLNLNDSVIFIKPTLQIDQYYMDSSIFAMSSRFEGLPLVLIEAKAYGLPIVSFDCETGPREIIRNGIDGTLVPPDNIDLFANALLDLMEDDKKRIFLGKNTQDNIRDYSPERFYASWEQLFMNNTV